MAAAHPDRLASLQQRASELAGQSVEAMLLETEFQTMQKRMGLPPALPGEEFELKQEP